MVTSRSVFDFTWQTGCNMGFGTKREVGERRAEEEKKDCD